MYNNYIPTNKHMKSIFGADDPICMSGPELHTYAKEHDLLLGLLRIQFRIATEEDIAHWGVKATPMSPADFAIMWASAVECRSKAAFVSDGALSICWGDIGSDDPIPNERIEFLGNLWDAAHGSLGMFAEWADVSIGDLCRSMGIDYQSAHQWQADPKSIPEYVRVMLARTIGMI